MSRLDIINEQAQAWVDGLPATMRDEHAGRFVDSHRLIREMFEDWLREAYISARNEKEPLPCPRPGDRP